MILKSVRISKTKHNEGNITLLHDYDNNLIIFLFSIIPNAQNGRFSQLLCINSPLSEISLNIAKKIDRIQPCDTINIDLYPKFVYSLIPDWKR